MSIDLMLPVQGLQVHYPCNRPPLAELGNCEVADSGSYSSEPIQLLLKMKGTKACLALTLALTFVAQKPGEGWRLF